MHHRIAVGHETSAIVFGSHKYDFLRKLFLFISPEANVGHQQGRMSLLKWLKSPRKQSAVSVQEPRRQRESVPDFEPRPQQEIVNEESLPEGTSEKTVDTTTASLGKRPRSSDTSSLSDVVLKTLREESPTVISQPVFEMASDLAEAPSWLGSLIEQINKIKASVTEQISSMNDKVDSVLRIVDDINGFKKSVTNKFGELERSVIFCQKPTTRC